MAQLQVEKGRQTFTLQCLAWLCCYTPPLGPTNPIHWAPMWSPITGSLNWSTECVFQRSFRWSLIADTELVTTSTSISGAWCNFRQQMRPAATEKTPKLDLQQARNKFWQCWCLTATFCEINQQFYDFFSNSKSTIPPESPSPWFVFKTKIHKQHFALGKAKCFSLIMLEEMTTCDDDLDSDDQLFIFSNIRSTARPVYL